MKSCGPFSASTAAHCEIEDGFEVDCDWIVAIALISCCRAAGIADAPAGHAIGLRHAVHRQRAVVELRLDLRRRGELEVVVDEVLVHVVGHAPRRADASAARRSSAFSSARV